MITITTIVKKIMGFRLDRCAFNIPAVLEENGITTRGL